MTLSSTYTDIARLHIASSQAVLAAGFGISIHTRFTDICRSTKMRRSTVAHHISAVRETKNVRSTIKEGPHRDQSVSAS